MQTDEDDFLTDSAHEERVVKGKKIEADFRDLQGQSTLMQHVDCWILSDLTRKMESLKLQRDEERAIQKIMVPAGNRNNRTSKMVIKKKTIQNF
jgi:hypothetical protein